MGGWLSFSPFLSVGKEMITMDIFLEFLKDVLRGFVRAISAHFVQRVF